MQNQHASRKSATCRDDVLCQNDWRSQPLRSNCHIPRASRKSATCRDDVLCQEWRSSPLRSNCHPTRREQGERRVRATCWPVVCHSRPSSMLPLRTSALMPAREGGRARASDAARRARRRRRRERHIDPRIGRERRDDDRDARARATARRRSIQEEAWGTCARACRVAHATPPASRGTSRYTPPPRTTFNV